MCEVCERTKAEAKIFNGLLDLLMVEFIKRAKATSTLSRAMQGYVLLSRTAILWCDLFNAVDDLPAGTKREWAMDELDHYRNHLLSILGDVRQIVSSANPTVTMMAMNEENKEFLKQHEQHNNT